MKVYYSGGTGNIIGDGSLGGPRSNTEIPNNQIGNLWDTINRVEILSGRTEYRCFYLFNDDVIDTTQCYLELVSAPPGTKFAIAINPPDGVQSITTEDTPPTGLTFFEIDQINYNQFRLPIKSLKVGEERAVWLRRISTTQGIEDELISFKFNFITRADISLNELSYGQLVNVSILIFPSRMDVAKIGKAVMT